MVNEMQFSLKLVTTIINLTTCGGTFSTTTTEPTHEVGDQEPVQGLTETPLPVIVGPQPASSMQFTSSLHTSNQLSITPNGYEQNMTSPDILPENQNQPCRTSTAQSP